MLAALPQLGFPVAPARRGCRILRRLYWVVHDYLERYRDGLLGHPVARDRAGKVIAVVERTNNVAEHFSPSSKQRLRRRSGRAHLDRDMEDQPAQTALATNLLDPGYVRIACGTLDQLPDAFAELDRAGIHATTPLQRNNKDAGLRKRIRVWAADDQLRLPGDLAKSPQMR